MENLFTSTACLSSETFYNRPCFLFHIILSNRLYCYPLNTHQSTLPEQIPRGVIHMIVGESRHGEITMVVPVLPSDIHFPLALCGFLELFGQELALLVEIVGCALS